MAVQSKLESAISTLRWETVPRYLAAFVALFVLRVVLRAVYRILFHPLKKFPGPKLAALSNLPYLYHTVNGTEVSWAKELHEKYGEVVRCAPDRLSYISPQAWKDITGHRLGGRPELGKDMKHFYTLEQNGEASLIVEPSAQSHGQVRRIFSSAFSDRALKLQEPLIREHVDKLKWNIDQALAADQDARLDIVKLLNFTTFDVMGDLTFGETLGMLDTGEYTPWVRTVFQSIKASALLRTTKFYPALAALLQVLLPPSTKGKQMEHFMHSAERVDKRLEQGANVGKSDIWKLVLENQKTQLPLTKMHANASVFMLAGTETTATLLSGMLYLLLNNPDKMKKVVTELRALPKEDLSLEVLPRLEYLNVCFEEALRCYPPVPAGLPREVPKGGAEICGEWVPEGTCVAVTQWAAYSSPLNFKDPDKFVPERWLPGTGYETDRKEVFQPFSYGPRNCIGKNLAYHEMRIIAAMLLWHYDVELCPESKNWIDQKSYTIWEKPALMLKFKSIQS